MTEETEKRLAEIEARIRLDADYKVYGDAVDDALWMVSQVRELTTRDEQWQAKYHKQTDTFGELVVEHTDQVASLRNDRDVLLGEFGKAKLRAEAAECKLAAEVKREREPGEPCLRCGLKILPSCLVRHPLAASGNLPTSEAQRASAVLRRDRNFDGESCR